MRALGPVARSLRWTLVALAVWTVAFGCRAVAGIEDRRLDPSVAAGSGGSTGGSTGTGGSAGTGASGGGPSSECQEYCRLTAENCVDEHAVYQSPEVCHAVCALMAAGDPDDPTDDTIACRVNQAVLARQTAEPDVHCPRAGPTGGDSCGSYCEVYCDLFMQACPGRINDRNVCIAACAGIPDNGGFDLVDNYNENSIQCRFVHLNNATLDPDTHCSHAAILSSCPCCVPDAGGLPPSCESYCTVAMAACSGPLAVYESNAQCLAACEAFELGEAADTTPNTVACRRYHSTNAFLAPETHCPHAGPGGDGHCGKDNCDGYCDLMSEFCPGEYASESDCLAECSRIEGHEADKGFALGSITEGLNMQCLLREAVRTSATPGDATQCAAARGTSGPCAN